MCLCCYFVKMRSANAIFFIKIITIPERVFFVSNLAKALLKILDVLQQFLNRPKTVKKKIIIGNLKKMLTNVKA